MSVRTAVDVTHSSSRISGILAVMAGVIAVVSVAFTSVLALLFGVLGLVGIAAGIFALDSRRGVMVGSGVLFVAVLLSGMYGNITTLLIAGTLGTIVAMDLGQNAVSVGRQLTTDAYTRRGEFVHAFGTVAVGVIVGALAYTVYLVSPSGQPLSALVLLLLAGVLFVWSFRT